MTISELRAKLPAPLQGFADTYGPVVLAWTAADLQAWLNLLLKGNVYDAYAQVLQGMGGQQSVDEWATVSAGWAAANADNAARADLAKSALAGLLKIVLAVALAAVGL